MVCTFLNSLKKSRFQKTAMIWNWMAHHQYGKHAYIINIGTVKVLRQQSSLTRGIWKEPRLLSRAIDTPEAASPMITGDTVICRAAQPKLELMLLSGLSLSLFTLLALEPLSGWPFTNSKDAFRDTGMSSQLSRMWKPSLSCGRRSLRWLISLIAKVIVCIQRKARELKLYRSEKQFITQHKYMCILKYPEHTCN